MPNIIEKVAVLNTELDRAAVEELTSGWMDLNKDLVKYNGGREVKLPEMTMDGLADYDREKGFIRGSVNLKWRTYEMTQDRGRKFTFDENEVDESNFILTASRAMGEFQRQRVVPEIDAYRYSKLASVAVAKSRARGGYTPTVDDILTNLYADIAEVEDAFGAGNIIITISRKVAAILDTNREISRQISVGDFAKGDVAVKVKLFDGEYPLIRVPADRLKTSYIFKTGKEGQEDGGFTPSPEAKDINWIVSFAKAPIAVNKTDKMRVFDPETYQEGRMWSVDYRKFHELWLPENKVNGVFVNIRQAL